MYFNFLHSFVPNPVLISFGPFTIYWYGFFIVVGMMLGIILTLRLAKLYKISEEKIIDLSFWLIIFSVIGARLYHVAIQFSYYKLHLLEIPMIWRGGIAIHGAIFTGLIVIWIFSRKQSISFLKITSIIAPALALAQTIGRWGNYFNQELFGPPTNMSWGIPISINHRPEEFINYTHFQPAFLYESLGNLVLFLLLIFLNFQIIKHNKFKLEYLSFIYLIGYSILRFFMEYIRIDPTPQILIFRLPQIVSLLIIIVSVFFIYKLSSKKPLEKKETLC